MGEKTRYEVKITIFSQGARKSCWLACYKMLLAYRGKSTTDESIKKAFDKANLNFKDAKTHGLSDKDFPKACKALGLVHYGTPFGHGKAEDGAARVLLKYLEDRGPLWVAGTWPGFHHIHVVHGADTKREMLCRVDPWNNGITAAESLWVDFDGYVAGVKQSIKAGIQHW